MKALLTDFTYEEIAFALIQVNEGIAVATHALAKNQELYGEKNERCEFWQKQIDMGLTWKIQLMTAQTVVKDRETVTAN